MKDMESGVAHSKSKNAERVKVDRHCPRCLCHSYVQGIKHRNRCAIWGHEWQGRIRHDEIDGLST